jgi:HEAT repeats
MAEVTLGFDELEDGDLPLVCMECGARRRVDFVDRTFVRRPLFAPGLIGMALTKRVHVAIPLCQTHGGPRFFALQGVSWWGLRPVAIGADRITISRVHEEFAEALRRRRDKRRRGEPDESEPLPRRRVRVGRGPGGGMAAFKVLGIVVAVMVGLVVFMSCGMFGLMALTRLWLPKAPPIAAGPPVPVATTADVEMQPECVVVGLLGVAPDGGFPGAVPWAPLGLSSRKNIFHLLEDAELTKLLADLRSPNPGAVEQAAKQLSKATLEEARRKETADALQGALANPFPTAKKAVAEALGKWGSAENVPALIRMLADPNPSSRAAAMIALAAFKDARGADAVASRLSDFFDKEQARKSLEAMGPVAEKSVAGLLNQPDPRVRVEACGVLRVIGTKESLPALEAMAHDPAPNVVQAAVEAVKAIKARR